jgi:hypothetical protein
LFRIVLAHLAHVADQVRGKTVARIQPALLVDRLQLRQFVAMRCNKGLLVSRHVLLDGYGLIAGLRTEAVQGGPQLIEIEIQPVCNHRQIGVHIGTLLAHQEAGDRRVVVHHQPVLAVEELAARRQDRLLANAVLLGQHAVASTFSTCSRHRPAARPSIINKMPYCTNASLTAESFSPRLLPKAMIPTLQNTANPMIRSIALR